MNKISPELAQWLPTRIAQASMDAHRVIRVAGPDAAALLQGQLSNDIDALGENAAQLSSYNSPKGRVLAFLRVLEQGEEFWLVVDAGIADAFLQRLKMFVLRSKVTIEAADDIAASVIVGPQAGDALSRNGWPLPEPGKGIAHAGCVIFSLPGPVPRYEIFGPADALPYLEIEQASAEDLACWDILFRLPRVNEANREQHVAQHLDLDELGAINFRKGCYTGQEIIARMKYLGKVKKRTRIFIGSGVNAGDSVRNDEDRSVGDVVNVADANGKQLILASVNLDAADQSLRVNDSIIMPASA